MSDSQQRYRVVEKLESGGMAEVFRAESEGLQGFRKQVAIKRVLPHLSSKKKFISMFLDEARLSAQLSHSNCVQVFDIGVGDNAFFIVMEFVDGANLKAIIEHMKKTGSDFPVEAAVYIALEICKGLAYAHELTDPNGVALHIVHRDMSPPNVLITKYGEVKIVDFGLAKANSQLEKSEPGIIKGKFSYLSPEAAMGQDVDARTDIFAVGIILWELLAGQRLFLGDTDFQTVKKVQARGGAQHLDASTSSVPPELETHHQQGPRARSAAALHDRARPRPGPLEVPVQARRAGEHVRRRVARAGRHEGAPAAPPDAGEHHRQADRRGAARVHVAHRRQGPAPAGGAKPIDTWAMRGPVLAKPTPRSGGYVNVGSWIDEIAVGAEARRRRVSRAVAAAGTSPRATSPRSRKSRRQRLRPNIARPWRRPPRRRPRPGSPVAALEPAPPCRRLPLRSRSAREEVERLPKVGVVVALVVVMAAGAAAWFTHLIPHP